MRLTRGALIVASTALTPALLFAAPAFAAGTPSLSTAVTATSQTDGTAVEIGRYQVDG
ncbi:hypothetical protein [Streptomyces sp. NPDC029041]|uniref:hypothetical protein n=1 Tax=Streptomyces sp. NPDC029041 TaxID=3155727 RepID=UPI0033E199FF